MYLCIFHCYNFSFGKFLCKHKENLVKGIYKKIDMPFINTNMSYSWPCQQHCWAGSSNWANELRADLKMFNGLWAMITCELGQSVGSVASDERECHKDIDMMNWHHIYWDYITYSKTFFLFVIVIEWMNADCPRLFSSGRWKVDKMLV